MAKRKSKAIAKVSKTTSAVDRLGKALARRTKAELIEVILEHAKANRTIMRELEARFDVEAPPNELVAATRQAIADATDFDEREINSNFDYAYEAYDTIKRNFGRLVAMNHLREAMDLSLELMKAGSYQVEMSDEGLMTDDIEQCLQVVIDAVRNSHLPAAAATAWSAAMLKADRVGFICDKELQALEQAGAKK